jgi:hypothetical protein
VPFSGRDRVALPRTPRTPVSIDWLGAFLITAGVCDLLIRSTLAGNRFAWASSQSAIFVVGGVVLLALAGYAESRAKSPIIPLGIFRNRTVSLTSVANVVVGLVMFGGTVFLSQNFQISLGKSPTVAGLMSLPLIFALLVSSTVAGQLVTKFRRWKAYLVVGTVGMTGGMLLLSTIDAHTGVLTLSVFMAVLGIGVGMLMQNLVLAAQNDVPAQELGVTTSALTFFRSMGGAIGVSALGAVLANRATSLLAERLGAGATGSTAKVPDLASLPPQVLIVVRDVYGEATAGLFLVGSVIALLAVLAVLFIKEKPLHKLTNDERRAREEVAAEVLLHADPKGIEHHPSTVTPTDADS